MKKSFTLIAAAVMAFAANAQDLIIATNASNPDIKVLQDARFDPVTNNLGNTSTNTVVCIGEVDFSENYAAAGLTFAQGWGGNGNFAVLYAGDDFETAQPFTQVALAHTQSYSNYVQLAGNMGYNANSPEDLSGGKQAQDGLRFYKPTGKKNVYLTFVGGAGNVRAVNFYKNAFTPEDFHAEGGWEPKNGQLLKPNEKANASEVITTLLCENSTLVASPSQETRIDGGNGWGWTTEGVVVNYGTVDFGNNDYKQICLFVGHWSNQPNDKIEVYLDNANDEANLVATIFTGMELRDNMYPKAQAFNKEITGQHTVLLKWRGGSTNVKDVELLKEVAWPNEPLPDYEIMTKVNDTPSENAKRYTMRNDVPEGAIKIQNHACLNQGQLEGNGNYGYTGPKTVIKLEGIDFENGQYNKVLMTYATGGDGWIDYKEHANISLYIDLEAEVAYAPMLKSYDWGNAHAELEAAGVKPIAVVRHQATGGWGNQLTIGDEMEQVAGVHTVYVVYYQKYTDQGANIFDYYLDTVAVTGIDDVKVNATKAYKTIENGQVVIVKGDMKYNIMGQPVK